jgi:3-deoxy-manno-octulosonate cytidylyltransferase (CMP-KDO synthetase)
VHALGRSNQPAPVVVAIIPARYHSTRLPGKPLVSLAGRPLVEHVYRRAVCAPGVGQVLVATDDERVREAVASFGGRCVMTDPAHRSGTDRLAEVAATLACDLVVNVQGDEPFIDPTSIGAAVEAASDPAISIATLRHAMDTPDDLADPAVVKVVVDRRGDALYFSRAPIPWARDEAGHFAPGQTFKHIGLYVYRRDVLLTLASLPPTPLERAESLEQLRALEHGYRIRTVESAHDSLGVDTPDDLARARRHAERAQE